MKKTILIAFLLLTFLSPAFAVLWQPRPIEEERAETIKKLEFLISEFKDSDAAKEAASLLQAEKATKNQEWVAMTIGFARNMLDRYPVSPENDAIRLVLLHILDHPLHIPLQVKNPDFNKVWTDLILQNCVNDLVRVADEVEKTKVPAGKLAIWKIYNLAFIVKSQNHAAGFDVHTFSSWREINPKLKEAFEKLAKSLDLAVVSHLHSDHFNSIFVGAMRRAGKPVLVPMTVGKWMARDPDLNSDVMTPTVFYGKMDQIEKINGIGVRSIPGMQIDLLNSLYILTLDGIHVMHTGDNSKVEVMDLMKQTGRIDVLIAASWNLNPAMCFALMKHGKGSAQDQAHPQFYIPAHENEMGHGIKSRESFWENYRKIHDRTALVPTFVLSNGENVCWPSGRAIQAKGLDADLPDAKVPAVFFNPWKRKVFPPVPVEISGSKLKPMELLNESGNKKMGVSGTISYEKGNNGVTLVFQFHVPDSKIVSKIKKRDGDVYDDDCLEILLAEQGDIAYYHFAINPDGVVYDSRNNNREWNGTPLVQSKKNADSWDMTVKIPVEAMGLNPEKLEGNICILDKPTGVFMNLSPSFGDFHARENFIQFELVK